MNQIERERVKPEKQTTYLSNMISSSCAYVLGGFKHNATIYTQRNGRNYTVGNQDSGIFGSK